MQLKLSTQKYLKRIVVHLSYTNHLLVIKLATQFYILPLYSILAEQKEKERRQLNIITNNMAESDDEDSSARKAGDITEATEEYL